MKLLLAGEGSTELGDWAKEPPYRPRPEEPFQSGVVEALLRRVNPEGWVVSDGVLWKSIRKFKAGEHRGSEMRNVLGLALRAKEAGYAAVVFTRDRDRKRQRHLDVEQGVAFAKDKFPTVKLAGGMATEAIEAWLLALLGERGSERRATPKEHLADEHGVRGTLAMVDVVARADIGSVPEDAESLRRWLDQARELIGSPPRFEE